MNKLLDRYGALLDEVDVWFQHCSRLYPDHISCHNGCSACCRGLFDITLLDAFYLKRGVDRLSGSLQQQLAAVARKRLDALTRQYPNFTEPWILNTMPEAEWEPLMPEEDETPCLLLDADGHCLIYEHRPMTCRLNGIPLIDESGEQLFDEWCTLNFVAEDPRTLHELRHRFNDLFGQELLLFRELTRRLAGTGISEVDLFIPAAVVLDIKKILPVVAKLAGQSTATIKLPAKPELS